MEAWQEIAKNAERGAERLVAEHGDGLHAAVLWTLAQAVVAAGTSLPELASAIASARRGQNELTLGNIIGSNFFNALAVVGASGAIAPFRNVSPLVLARDLPVMVLLTFSIGIFGFNFRNPRSAGTVSRICGIVWLAAFLAYMTLLVRQEVFVA